MFPQLFGRYCEKIVEMFSCWLALKVSRHQIKSMHHEESYNTITACVSDIKWEVSKVSDLCFQHIYNTILHFSLGCNTLFVFSTHLQHHPTLQSRVQHSACVFKTSTTLY